MDIWRIDLELVIYAVYLTIIYALVSGFGCSNAWKDAALAYHEPWRFRASGWLQPL